MKDQPLNPNGVGALLHAKKVILHRAVNGWMVTAEDNAYDITKNPFFCFESTSSLAYHLKAMLGETKWIVSEPARDEKGKFQPKAPKE